LLYSNPNDMQIIIDSYFKDCAYNRALMSGADVEKLETEVLTTYDEHPTISGLALVLDFTRKSLLNYEGREEFLPTIKKS